MAAVETVRAIPWWKEPTKDQWYAFVAAWLGWTLDAFDFTIFLLIMLPISQEFNVPLTDVTVVFTLTLWMRLIGATASGWMADRMGRKLPLMISIFGYSMCNFIAGRRPSLSDTHPQPELARNTNRLAKISGVAISAGLKPRSFCKWVANSALIE